MNQSPIASDLSFECLQKRLRARELETPHLNDQNRRLFGIPSQVVVREAFIADRIVGVSEREWEQRKRQSQLQ